MMSDKTTDNNCNVSGDDTPKRNGKLEQMRARLKPSLFNSEPISPAASEGHSAGVIHKLKTPNTCHSETSSPRIPLSDDKKKNFESFRANIRSQMRSNFSITSQLSVNEDEEEKSRRRASSVDRNDNNDQSTTNISVAQSLKKVGTNTDDNDERGSQISLDQNLQGNTLSDRMSYGTISPQKGESTLKFQVNENLSPYSNETLEDVTPMTHKIFQKFMASEEEKIGSHEENVHYITNAFKDLFEEHEVLGEGASGTVKRCIKIETGQEYAVKITNYRGDEELKVLITTEFRNLRRLKHKNIVEVIELYIDETRGRIYTIMELVKGKEMFEFIHETGSYSEIVASETFKQILLAIQYMHKQGVCHRDLKPNNILVSEDSSIVKITDFNVSKFSDNDKKKYTGLSNENYKMWTYTGTIAFTAPEVFTDTEYTEAVDMWSAGVVLYTMLSGYQPFQAEYLNDLIELIKEGKASFQEAAWKNISAEARDLVKHLLQKKVKDRFSPSQALAHPWINNIKRVSGKEMVATIRNLRSNIRKNSRNCFLIEPTTELEAKRVKIQSDFDETTETHSPSIRQTRQRGQTCLPTSMNITFNKVASHNPSNNKQPTLTNQISLFERVQEEEEEK